MHAHSHLEHSGRAPFFNALVACLRAHETFLPRLSALRVDFAQLSVAAAHDYIDGVPARRAVQKRVRVHAVSFGVDLSAVRVRITRDGEAVFCCVHARPTACRLLVRSERTSVGISTIRGMRAVIRAAL